MALRPRPRGPVSRVACRRPRRRFAVALIFALGLSVGVASRAQTPADLIILNADIRTVDSRNPRAVALAVGGGKFLAVGRTVDVTPFRGPGTRVIDVGGVTVLPGLIDSHAHLTAGLRLVRGVDLYNIRDKREWLKRISRRAATLAAGEWLMGGRWDHTLGDGVLPSRHDLDRVVSDRPVALADVDGHSLWLNSLALSLLHITAKTPVPAGGEIVIDTQDGTPTGILKEAATGLVYDSPLLAVDTETRRRLLRQTIGFANSLGITAVHDMAELDRLGDYIALLQDKSLSLRIWYGPMDLAKSGKKADDIAAIRDNIALLVEAAGKDRAQGPMLTLGFIKFMIDGVLSTRTAALLQPYSDRPETSGTPFYSQKKLNRLVNKYNRAGFPVAIHAIGDRGVRMALDAFAASPVKPKLANRIEHLELVDRDDLGRFAALGVAASMTPDHGAGVIGKYIGPRIGLARESEAYIWKDIIRSGALLAWGSDWPTSPLNPLLQIKDAVFRESPMGLLQGLWHPENRLSFDEALFAYTQAGANLAGWGDRLGSISPGKWADFVILDGRLPVPVERSIVKRRVTATFLAGQVIYTMPK